LSRPGVTAATKTTEQMASWHRAEKLLATAQAELARVTA